MQPLRHRQRSKRHEAFGPRRGAAALVVVMVLFFIVALVAAYTGRNLIFEQRTSANQYRSTQAFEAAEAGLEWALAMLNGGRIDAACQPHTDPTTIDTSFRQRYLNIDTATGAVAVRTRSDGQPLRAACVFDGSAWACSCPTDAAPALTAPTGAGPFPAFVVRLYENNPPYPAGSPPYPPGVVRVESTGCTRLDAGDVCAPTAAAGDGRATVTILAALKSALATPPTAAVTVRGNLTHNAAGSTRVINSDVSSGGFTLQLGGTESFTPPADLLGPPGSPSGSGTVARSDASLLPPTVPDAEKMFASVFGMNRGTYRLQPAAVVVDCSTPCAGSAVSDLAKLNPGRVLWLDGDLAPDDAVVGSPAEPVALVVDGNVLGSDDLQVNGVMYQTGASWTQSGDLTLVGALIAESSLIRIASGSTTIAYDRGVLDRLRWASGSFVRVPGSWRDF